jgi:hypothetical protein
MSSVWPTAPQCSHHSLMSAAEGVCRPYSILETLLPSCQPARRASSRAVSPASTCSSRSRRPSASSACRALEDEEASEPATAS